MAQVRSHGSEPEAKPPAPKTDVAVSIRAVRPDDAERIADMVERSAPIDVLFRFGTPFRRLPPDLARRLAGIDLSRDMAFVAEAEGQILGVARMARDPDETSAEIAVMVRSDAQEHGLGRLLMDRLAEHARTHGVRSLWGLVRSDNALVLALAQEAGFTQVSVDLDGVRIERDLA